MMQAPLLTEVTRRLTSISDTPALDASVLIAHIIEKPRTWVLAHTEILLTPQQKTKLHDSLARLERGEPFPYVLGHWEFFGLEFELTPGVLIPRPETELLVEKAIAWLQESPVRRTIADVGTGSGAVAVAIAVNVPDVQVLATDISLEALKVARRNAIKFDVTNRINFVQCDLLPYHIDPLPSHHQFDLICANLPYIPTDSLHSLPVFGREPTLALDGGADGLELIRRLLEVGSGWLAPAGMMLLELESTRGAQALALACDMFSQGTIHLHQDLAGKDRLLQIRL